MISEEDILEAINTVLYNNDYITKEVYLKCGKPKYISSLPGDLRSNDPQELKVRLDAIEDEISARETILKNASTRINRKLKDSERLSKRVDKNMEAMNKAQDNIASESDKIVKNIEELEDKIKNSDMEKSLKDEALDRIKILKKTHNNFFNIELTSDNVTEYRGELGTLDAKNTSLHNILLDLYNGKLITKSDMNKGDISKNIKAIDKNITKYEDTGKKVTGDVESIQGNQQDIDYITSQSKGVSKEIDVLLDEFEKTHNKYVENGGSKRSTPNPQMILDSDAKTGDSFTFLPTDYDKYMVET